MSVLTPAEYIDLEWGDYLRRHADIVQDGLNYPRFLAEACVRINIIRGHAPDDLGEQIVALSRSRLF